MNYDTLGCIIGRMNPPHIGHLNIIDKALKENDRVLLLIGVKENIIIKDDKNPFTFEQIREILMTKYSNEERLRIVALYDKPTDAEWVKYLNMYLFDYYMNIFECYLGANKLNFYFGDFKIDSAYIAIKQNQNLLTTHDIGSANRDYNINYIEVPREFSFINYKGKTYPVSSTNLRQALKDKNFSLAEKFCDKKMFPKILDFYEKLSES